MKLLTGAALSVATYVVAGAALVLLAQSLLPTHGLTASAGFSATATATDPQALALELAAHCMACFLAGAAGCTPARLSLKAVVCVIGSTVFLLVAITTMAWWSAMPDWYDVTVILLTLPFFALGAAWRHAARGTPI